MEEQQAQITNFPEDINPIFELYTLLRDAEDPRFTDAEIRQRLRNLRDKLKILFAMPPSSK